jgi:hypothetical protein
VADSILTPEKRNLATADSILTPAKRNLALADSIVAHAKRNVVAADSFFAPAERIVVTAKRILTVADSLSKGVNPPHAAHLPKPLHSDPQSQAPARVLPPRLSIEAGHSCKLEEQFTVAPPANTLTGTVD